MTTHQVNVDSIGNVEINVAETGTGRPIVLLHGGAGPQSVAGFAQLLASRHPVRVLTPTHPGFGGTARPEALNSVRGLGAVYARLLEQLQLEDVTVFGNSIGGWVAAELALADHGHLRDLVISDALGVVVEGHPPVDVSHMTPAEITKRSYYNPAVSPINFATLTDQQKAGMAANRATLMVYRRDRDGRRHAPAASLRHPRSDVGRLGRQ